MPVTEFLARHAVSGCSWPRAGSNGEAYFTTADDANEFGRMLMVEFPYAGYATSWDAQQAGEKILVTWRIYSTE